MWNCAAYKTSVAIFSDGIAPCCMFKTYRKPIEQINDRNVFTDLIGDTPHEECKLCQTQEEKYGLTSYRQFFNSKASDTNDLQFVDIRNTNLCNLKCRTCGPHFSSQWAKEQKHQIEIKTVGDLEKYYDDILKPSVIDMYFTGGEPLISKDHWDILTRLVELGYSKRISLRYNTNLTTLKFKDVDMLGLWNNFRTVNLQCSLDSTGEQFNYVRSGASWTQVEQNLKTLLTYNKIRVSIFYTISILNFWNMEKDIKYFKDLNLPMVFSIIHGPDILCMDCVPDELKELALSTLNRLVDLIPNDIYNALSVMINDNYNSNLFKATLSHILYLDKIREERLFDFLPFKEIAYKLIIQENG